MELYEFIPLDLNGKGDIVFKQSVFLANYSTKTHSYSLYKLPNFYVEVEISTKDNQILDITGFKRGVRLDKYLDKIKIDVF